MKHRERERNSDIDTDMYRLQRQRGKCRHREKQRYIKEGQIEKGDKERNLILEPVRFQTL